MFHFCIAGLAAWAVPLLCAWSREGGCFACPALGNAERVLRSRLHLLVLVVHESGRTRGTGEMPRPPASPPRAERRRHGSACRGSAPRHAPGSGPAAPLRHGGVSDRADKQLTRSAWAQPRRNREYGKSSFTFTLQSSASSSFMLFISSKQKENLASKQ